MNQLNLFGDDDIMAKPKTAPYQPHSDTSRAAADAVAPKLTGQRALVWDYISARGSHGATDEEIQIGMCMNPSTQRPRRVELWRGGLIEKLIVDGEEVKRKTASGSWANVWVLVQRDFPPIEVVKDSRKSADFTVDYIGGTFDAAREHGSQSESPPGDARVD